MSNLTKDVFYSHIEPYVPAEGKIQENSGVYTTAEETTAGDIKLTPASLYGITSRNSYIRVSQNQQVVFELPEDTLSIDSVRHTGYTIGNSMPPANITKIEVSNNGTEYKTLVTYSMPTYGITGEVTNGINTNRGYKYVRLTFWFHGSGYPAYYSSGGVGSLCLTITRRVNNAKTKYRNYLTVGKKFYKKVITTQPYTTDNISRSTAFLQSKNPNHIDWDLGNTKLVAIKLNVRIAHVGGGDTVGNHSFIVTYADGSTATLWTSSTSLSSGTVTIDVPIQDKAFSKFTYQAYQYYNTGYNIGSNIYVTFVSATKQTQTWQPCTKAEYDNATEVERLSTTSYYLGGGKQKLKKVIKDTPWEQPTLTSNGSAGGDSFAVFTSSAVYSGTFCSLFNHPTGSTEQVDLRNTLDFGWYNPVSINVKSITVTSYNLTYPANYGFLGLRTPVNVYGSNNGTDYTLIKTLTFDKKEQVQTIDLTDNVNWYKYYKVTTGTWYTPAGQNCWMPTSIKINAIHKGEVLVKE